MIRHLRQVDPIRLHHDRSEAITLRYKAARLLSEFAQYAALSYYLGGQYTEMALAILDSMPDVSKALGALVVPETLKELATRAEEAYPLGLVMELVLDVAEWFNVKDNIQPHQIEATALMIMDEYPGWTLEHIGKCFELGKRGRYGEVNYKLDGSTLMRWLGTYHTKLRRDIQEENARGHASSKADPTATRISRDDPDYQAFKVGRYVEQIKQTGTQNKVSGQAEGEAKAGEG